MNGPWLGSSLQKQAGAGYGHGCSLCTCALDQRLPPHGQAVPQSMLEVISY